GAADVGAELDGVISGDSGPVVDELELVLVLNQGAIAAVHAERVTELEEAVAVAINEEGRHSGIKVLVHVQARNPRVGSGRRSDAGGLAEAIVAEPAEREVGEQRRMQDVVEAARYRVVPRFRRAGVCAGGTRGVETGASGDQAE